MAFFHFLMQNCSVAAAAAAAALSVKGDKDYALAVFVGDFVLHIVELVKACAAKLRKFFIAHKKHLLKNIISGGAPKKQRQKFQSAAENF